MEETLKRALYLLAQVVVAGYQGQGGVYRSGGRPTCLHCGSNWATPFEHSPNCMIVGIEEFLASVKDKEE